jgi:hypothetical protein
MNTPLKSTFYCIGFLVILLSCKKESKKYSHDIGYIDPATALGDKEFKTCSDRIYEYYNFEPYAGYKYGKRALRDSIAKKYSAIGNESGYLTFRFVVNCKGSAGRYQIIENDLDLKPKKFNKELVSHLFSITQQFKEWQPAIWENESRDYNIYLTYKLRDSKIIEILP